MYLEVRNGPLTAHQRRADALKIWDAVTDTKRRQLLDRYELSGKSARECRKRQPHGARPVKAALRGVA